MTFLWKRELLLIALCTLLVIAVLPFNSFIAKEEVRQNIVESDNVTELKQDNPPPDKDRSESRDVQVSRSGVSRSRIIASYEVKATAYGAHTVNGGAGTNLSYIGKEPVEGRTIAVDPKLVPIGSKVLVDCPSYPEVNGEKVAEDIGGAIKGNRIDIYFDDINTDPIKANRRMVDFGSRDVTIHILQE